MRLPTIFTTFIAAATLTAVNGGSVTPHLCATYLDIASNGEQRILDARQNTCVDLSSAVLMSKPNDCSCSFYAK